jgi:hypothetical protein
MHDCDAASGERGNLFLDEVPIWRARGRLAQEGFVEGDGLTDKLEELGVGGEARGDVSMNLGAREGWVGEKGVRGASWRGRCISREGEGGGKAI